MEYTLNAHLGNFIKHEDWGVNFLIQCFIYWCWSYLRNSVYISFHTIQTWTDRITVRIWVWKGSTLFTRLWRSKIAEKSKIFRRCSKVYNRYDRFSIPNVWPNVFYSYFYLCVCPQVWVLDKQNAFDPNLIPLWGPLIPPPPPPNDILNTEFRNIQQSFSILWIEKLPGYTFNITGISFNL